MESEGRETERKKPSSPSTWQSQTRRGENCLIQTLRGQKAEQKGGKGVNITKQEYSVNATFRKKGLPVQRVLYQAKTTSRHDRWLL